MFANSLNPTMRKFIPKIIVVIGTLPLLGCLTTTEKTTTYWGYIETELPFTELKYAKLKNNAWIRKPENILSVHETLKKIGYTKLVSVEDLNTYQMWYYSSDEEYLNIPLGVKIDSLVITYPNYKQASKFYKEFWQRRVNEQNDKATFQVLSEVSAILIHRKTLPVQEELVNDTLYRLASYELDTTSNEVSALQYFTYLKSIGLHHSAYNLLFENYRYQNLSLNRDSLATTLTKTNLLYTKEPWLMDDTK